MQDRTQSAGVTVAVPPRRGVRVLVVDGDRSLVDVVGAVLRTDGYTVRGACSRAETRIALGAEPYDIVLADTRLGETTNDDLLSEIHSLAPAATLFVLTGYATLDTALSALRAGAYGYLVKPLDLEELRISVGRAAEVRRLEGELAERLGELELAHDEVRAFNLRLQQQVEGATADLQRKVDALDEANSQLRAAQEQHDRFVAMVAHEMRGPLNPIINYAQLAKRPTVTQETRDRYMDLVVEHAFRLNRLVDDLQTATRLSTGQFSLRRDLCDVTAAITEVVEHFTATVRDRQFSLLVAAEPVHAEVDRDRLVQAVRNLIDNAVKYSVEQGAIEIGVRREEQCVAISVGDYGAGIPLAEMRRIFDAFTRLDDHSRTIAGSGLGLYITRGIVAAHGGSLDVENRSGDERAGGAIFTIRLPLRFAPAVI